MTPDQPTQQWRISWQSRTDGPGDRYTRAEHTAERMAKVLKLRGIDAIWWQVTIWEIAA